MKKIDHIAVAVESIKDSVKIYTDLLGVEPEIEQIADEHVNTAMFKLSGASIELVEPIDENSPVSKFLQKRGTGIHHICLEVDDLEASISLEKQRI